MEIPFRGTGWVYLGELSSRRGISFDSRRLDLEGQSFIFRTEEAGTYVLKFYKQDFLRDYILNDHVQVIVGEAPDSAGIGLFNPPVDRGRVIAEPRWPLSDEDAAAMSQPYSESQTVTPFTSAAETAPREIAPSTEYTPQELPPQTTETLPGAASYDMTPDEYIRQATLEFNAGRVEAALSILDRFRVLYPSGTDEAWWLYAQLLEANSPLRDIRLALEYYRRLVREFPQSPRVPDAQRRIAYLERFYINIQ